MKLRTVVHRRFGDGDGGDGKGHRFVYAQPSAAILAIDAGAASLLDAFAGEGREAQDGLALAACDDGEATLRELVELGLIRPAGEARVPAADLPPMPFPLATLVLNVTNKCNLSCTYCYEYGEDKLGPGRASKAPPRMSDETARQSIDFLFENAGERPQVAITFFGGETLLNVPAILAAVEHANARGKEHNKRVHFALTTNATLLEPDVVELLVAHRFGITVSIDGDRSQQDRHRVFKSGKGSFDVIAPRIRYLVDRNKAARGRPIGARVTLTRDATSVLDTFRYLTQELGFDEVGFAPVTADPSRDYALPGAAYDQMLAEFSALAEEHVSAALRDEACGFANLNDLLRELHHGVNKAHPCGAGLGLLGVSTAGDLGLCHRFVESESHGVGDVVNGIDEAARTAFLRAGHVDNKTDCNTCFARPLCAGGCYHEAHVRFGEATRPNLHACEWIRGWTDIGLSAYARIAAGNPRFFLRFESA